MEETWFDWPIVLYYDVKGKYRLVSSRKFSRKEIVSAEVSLNHPKATYARFYPLDKLIKSLYLRSFAVSVLFARFSFQGHAKIALMMRKHVLLSSFQKRWHIALHSHFNYDRSYQLYKFYECLIHFSSRLSAMWSIWNTVKRYATGERDSVDEEEKERKREEEEKHRYERILGEIHTIVQDEKTEGQIRQLEKKISSFHNTELKDQLLDELSDVSCRGLSKDLQKMVEKAGLASEARTLVSKFLTKVPELAEHLYLTSKDVLNGEGLGMVKRRLGPNLEVLGGLKARGIDVTKPWVKRLTDKVPSLHSLSRLSAEELESLCTTPDEPKKAEEPPSNTDTEGSGKPTESEDEGEKASKGELEVVRQLGKVAEAYNRQTSAVPPDLKLPSENPDTKAVDEEKLKKATELMNEAKALASEQSEEAKKATKEKMAEMMEVLELPSDWCKQDKVTPEQLLTDLGGIIDQYSSITEVAESYKNDLDAVAKASGGRALRGIYYSKYASPQTAGRPIILMPSNVTLTNPDDAMKITYLKFQESRAAANYVHTVKSSSTSIGFGVAGFYEGFVGEVKGAYSTEEHRDETRSVKTYSTSASVLQFIWTAKKCFQIEQEQMKLTESAKLMANCISKVSEKDAEKRKARARRFMEMFGSHVPTGVQTLGGVFFSIADAESEGVQKTTTLTKAATEKLQAQMSFGFLGGAFGIGGSVKAEHQGSTGETQAEQEDQKKTSYTYTVHAMGPAATNPVVFQKLLAYNSTWALIDRGPHEAYIPIWELLRSLGGSYEDAAQVLEATWNEEEETKKEVSKQLKKIYDKRRKKEDVRKELEELSKEYQARVCTFEIFTFCFF